MKKSIIAVIIIIIAAILIAAAVLIFAPKSESLSDAQYSSMMEQLILNEVGGDPIGRFDDGCFVFGAADGSLEDKAYECGMADYLDVIKIADCKVYDVRSDGDELVAYIWFTHGSYTCFGGNVYQCGSGGSYPMRVTMKPCGDKVTVTGIKLPEDGAYYLTSLREMTPLCIYLRMKADNRYDNGEIAKISAGTDEKAQAYFGCPLSDDLFDLDLETGEYTITRINEGVGENGEYFFNTEIADSGTLPHRDSQPAI